MLKRINLRPYLVHAFIAALVYSIPVYFFIRQPLYQKAWLLYLGNFLFVIVIVLFILSFSRKRNNNAGVLATLTAGNIATALGTVLSFVFALLLLITFIPGEFSYGTADKWLKGAPANMILDKTRGLNFMVIANSFVGNISFGSFVSILFPFALKGDQTKEKVPEKQAEL
jgi:hypothetical protein